MGLFLFCLGLDVICVTLHMTECCPGAFYMQDDATLIDERSNQKLKLGSARQHL